VRGARGPGALQSEKQANILDTTDNFTKIGEDVFIAEVKNVNPKRTELCIPFEVAKFSDLARVNTPVHLNCEAHRGTIEVDNERSDAMLPPKLERQRSQPRPEPPLRERRIRAQPFFAAV
jgi:hypothetical protein